MKTVASVALFCLIALAFAVGGHAQFPQSFQANLINTPSYSGGAATPVLIQHVASSANPAGAGINGNTFKIPHINPITPGNVLVLAITYVHGQTPTITDGLGNKWGAPVCTADNGTGNYVASVFVLPVVFGGAEAITIGLGSSNKPFNYTISEFSNISSVSPVAGSLCAAGVVPNGSAVVNPGSFTPAPNNSGGGNLIWNYTALANGSGTTDVTSYMAASGFTMLDGDTAWTSNTSFFHGSQWEVQATQASVSPQMTVTGNTADGFNSVSVALRVAPSGGVLPSGIYIRKFIHVTNAGFTANATWNLQFPTTGNLRYIITANSNGIGTVITGVTDSEGNTWTAVTADTNVPQGFYFAGATANPNLIVHIGLSGTSPTASFRMFDIIQASGSPFQVVAVKDPQNCSSVTTIAHEPDITPTATNGLVIAVMGIGDGPGLGVTSPAGADWDLVTYAGETDLDLMENADAVGHFYNLSSLAAESWTWTITSNAGNSCAATGVQFK